MAQRQLSNLYYKLDAKLKARYAEKVSFIKGEDPYALNKAKFSRDVSHLPSLGYVYYYWLTVGMQPSLYSFSIPLLINCICKILNGDVLLSCSYPDIVVYLPYTTSFVTLEGVKNYKSLHNFKFFISGWVLEVEWKKYSEEGIVLIIGKVRHSYAANKTPLRPWVLVRCNGTVLFAHCTGMAGLAETCSHVGAVLHCIETAVCIRDDTTCTSKENKWLMPTPAQSIPYLPLSEMNFSAPKRQKNTFCFYFFLPLFTILRSHHRPRRRISSMRLLKRKEKVNNPFRH